MTDCFQSSSRHAIQMGVPGPKTISLYFAMMSLMASSTSNSHVVLTRYIQLFLQVLTATSCSFIISLVTPRQVTTIFFTPQKTQHYHHRSTCCIVGFLHTCIYSLQHIPEEDNFYLVCRQSRSSTLLLHCNACRMEHPDH